MKPSSAFASTLLSLTIAAAPAVAQQNEGNIKGTVAADATHAPIMSAAVQVLGTSIGARTDATGRFSVGHLTPGLHTVVVRSTGFSPDTFSVSVQSGETVERAVTLRAITAQMSTVTVTSPRLNETTTRALEQRRNADNIMSVLSGDVIRALPNANAAEAAARIPGISTERDEGEGKFVQIRGTEPRLSNVTVNGVHIPGTQSGSRVAKLDDVPTDILSAIEVTKTLSAAQDADAIGGSVNLVTKTPEGAPRGYVAGQFGQASLLDRTQGQGSLMYGGRVGANSRLGFLFGATWDHNNRAINDLELGWDTNDAGTPIPVEWDQRDYVYDRTRIGANGAFDYRLANGSTLFLKGMWSKFENFGTRYRFDVASGGDSAEASSGAAGIATGSTFVRESSNRTPVEQMFSLSGGGRSSLRKTELTYSVNYSGTRSNASNYRTNDFEYDGPTGDGLAVRYDGSNRKYPSFTFLNSGDATLAGAAGNYGMTKYSTSDVRTSANEFGGQVDALMRYGAQASKLQYGVKYRDESRDNFNLARKFSPTGDVALSSFAGGFSDPHFYEELARGFQMGPQPDHGRVNAFEDANPTQFNETTNPISDSLSNFSGGERVAAGYVMNTLERGALRINTGVRVEQTNVHFDGNVATTPADATGHVTGAAALRRVTGSQNYTDLFPSVQLRYAVNEQTNVRVAVTRGIARANYSDLAPHLSGEVCASCKLKFSNLSAGNPDLQPQHAWNADLLGERYIGSVGVVSAGVFYKSISDFIYKRQFVYHGPATEFDGYLGTEPTNGGTGTVVGGEFDYADRFAFLPRGWSGLGFDVNWTQVDSRAELLSDTAKSEATLGSPVVRHARLPRQARSIGNAALTYDSRLISARAAWQYQGESIYSYGDGSATPSGDNWLLPHSQLDASLTVNLVGNVAIQVQGLNLNNAVFGFYNGVPGTEFSNQREYYGRSLIVGVKYGFGASAVR